MVLKKQVARDALNNLITQGESVATCSADGTAWRDRCRTMIGRLFPDDENRAKPFRSVAFTGPLAAYATPEELRETWERGRAGALAALRGALEDLEAGVASSDDDLPRGGAFSQSRVTYVQGDLITQNIHGSTVGTTVAGRGASVGIAASLTQEQWKAEIRSLQAALVHDQDALDELQEGMYEGLHQVLRLLRAVTVDGEAQEAILAQIKQVVDDVWVERELPRLKHPAAEGLELLREATKLATPLAKLASVLS